MFITGGSGFIGREVVRLLYEAGQRDLVCLVRRPESLAAFPGVKVVHGDVIDAMRYRSAIPSGSTVLHLAAATGNASAARHWAVNVEGTRQLLEAGRVQKIERFIYVSSIATRFCDKRYYHYAQAKVEAEKLVIASGLPYLIVRPTMVLGNGSPIEAALIRLASGPAALVFGSGRVVVQPIDVKKLAALLVDLCASEGLVEPGIIEAGGPERLTIEALIRRFREGIKGRPGPVVHVPLGPLRAFLGAIEKVLPGHLPLTAGQLCSFVNDGCARPHPMLERLTPEIAMIERHETA